MSDTSNFMVLGLGFVLGLKHATDPDHIVAVTTFLGEERHLRRACAIGNEEMSSGVVAAPFRSVQRV